MSLIMKRRMQESQRKNGLNSTEISQSSCVKPVESQFNYNKQNCQTNMPLPMEKNNYYITPMPMQHQHNQRPMNLESIQQIKRAAEGDQRQANVTQVEKNTDVINPHSSKWSHSGNDGIREGESVKVDNPEMSTTNMMNSDVMTEGSAYYDTPIYIDPMTYQQQHNSINAALPNAATMVASNLAQQARCSNINCMNCKRTKF
ncbi:hypothetical protein PVAND_010897 [Polypedilum vanderplanki]|uniref:Uncharacterized protein n=1 Tax=Polypedilum vanderplanki TaxID=319348 RepID=A0A9J6CHW9_POLVA|nr:hypothetical protein PVAND_010897 [Polypedilum vanderplanki]